MVSFITSKTVFHQDVGTLVFGINVFYFDFGAQIDSVKQQIVLIPVGTGHKSHRRSSVLHNHLDYCFIAFKNTMQGTDARKFRVCSDVINICQSKVFQRVGVFLRSCFGAFFRSFIATQVFPVLWVDSRKKAIPHNKIPEIKSGYTIRAKTCI